MPRIGLLIQVLLNIVNLIALIFLRLTLKMHAVFMLISWNNSQSCLGQVLDRFTVFSHRFSRFYVFCSLRKTQNTKTKQPRNVVKYIQPQQCKNFEPSCSKVCPIILLLHGGSLYKIIKSMQFMQC